MNREWPRMLAGLGFFLIGAVPALGAERSAPLASLTSPGGEVAAEIATEGGEGALSYRVTFRGKPVVESSPMGVVLADGTALGENTAIEEVRVEEFREEYRQHPGKRSRVLNHYREAVFTLRENGDEPRTWELVVRAYDDGLAFRYRFPEQEGVDELAIAGERTGFRLPGDADAHALPLASFTTSHEDLYKATSVAEIPTEWLLGLPLLAELPEGGWVALSQANLSDYAGMYLSRDMDEATTLVARLSPRPDEPEVAVRAMLPHETPWRVVMIADEVERLVESDLVLNLNEPCAIGDTSWIVPGKTTFPWWNGFYEEGVAFDPDLNTETAKSYIDFCAEAGIPYHSLDGIDNRAWYGGPIRPYEGADITTGTDGLDFQEVLRYAESKGVKIRLWMHWRAAEQHMERAFPLFQEWGVEGVMLDFVDRDDQEVVNTLRRIIALAAENHLTVTLHGIGEPTGLERTFPNLLTSEAVLNYEYDKWADVGVPPEHDLTVPFTRMLAGPLDFHQGSFRGVPIEEFHPQYDNPLVIGTPCRMLATYVVFQNHLSMAADYPSAYRGHPALPILSAIPCTWDDTVCIEGIVGELAVVARRSGDDWWLGAMGGRAPRDLEIPLEFLGDGRYRAEVIHDDLEADGRLRTDTATVEAGDVLEVPLAPTGGAVIHFVPEEAVGGS